eukprot:151310_1
MGSVCATSSVADDATNYEQIKSGTVSKDKKDKQGFNFVHQTSTSVSTTIDDPRRYRTIRKTYKNYRIGITQSYIFDMQKLLYKTHSNAENKSYYQIPSRISSLILSFLPTYFFHVYGIGKNLVSNSEISEFERLHIFEPKLSYINNIYCGHDKYFIKSYISEIYAIGNNLFDGLCLNTNINENSENNYNLKHITSFYKYFDFNDLNSPIELISNSIYSNDIIIKLRNGSLYLSVLTMSGAGEWKRTFMKPKFDSHMDDVTISKHLNIISISCGLLHTLFLTDNGNVYSYGNNNNGQCGLGYVSKRENKIKIINQFIEENIQINSINCGKYHSSCIDNNGNLWCFGLNDNHQCSETEMSIIINKPIKIFYNLDRIIKVGCGESFTCYLTNKGYYYGFGKIIVSTIDKVNITKWDTNNETIFKDISCGANHILLIDIDNQIYSHGSNQYHKSGLKVGRANKPTIVKNDKLPTVPLIPCAVIAGMNNSVIIFNA